MRVEEKKRKAEARRREWLAKQASGGPPQPEAPRRSSLDEEDDPFLSDGGEDDVWVESSTQEDPQQIGGQPQSGALQGAAALSALRDLMEWKAAGHLDEEEFQKAKKKILG